MEVGGDPPSGAAAVGKALRLLGMFTVERPWWTLSELAKACTLPLSTTSRLLAVLEQVGAVRRDTATLRYTVGAGVLAWARVAQLTLPSQHGVHEMLVRLAASTGETAAVYLRHGDVRICIDVVQSVQPVHRAIPLGEVAPLTSGAAGRAIISYLPEAEQEALGLHGDDRARLRQARAQGLVCAYRDRLKDAWAIASPLKNQQGDADSALVLTGPVSRYRPGLFAELGATVREAARDCALRAGIPREHVAELLGPLDTPQVFGADPPRESVEEEVTG